MVFSPLFLGGSIPTTEYDPPGKYLNMLVSLYDYFSRISPEDFVKAMVKNGYTLEQKDTFCYLWWVNGVRKYILTNRYFRICITSRRVYGDMHITIAHRESYAPYEEYFACFLLPRKNEVNNSIKKILDEINNYRGVKP